MNDPFSQSFVPARQRRGRGAIGNPAGRFETHETHEVNDGWAGPDADSDQIDGVGAPDLEDDLPPLQTTVTQDTSRTIIARNTSPDLPFDRSVNPYRGCEHGCIYCYARPSHGYLGLSAGLDFETKLFVKKDAAALLAKEFRKKGYRPSMLALGSNTDPYQPLEKRLKITRAILKTLADFSHPVSIVTKSALVTRDMDILAPMAAKGLASVGLSLTSLDHRLSRSMEPRAATPKRRLEAMKRLSDSGIPVIVMAAPMIPALNDHELESLLEAAADHGATSAATQLLRLPHELKDLFKEWLEKRTPGKAGHVLSLIRQSRAGELSQSDFGRRMTGSGPYALLLMNRFALACRKYGLNAGENIPLRNDLFHIPPQKGDQLSFL